MRDSKTISMLKIQDEILFSIREYLRRKGFVEILPPIIGPVTDPGIRGAKQASIDYYGSEFKLMSSMILYKQMAICSLDRVFTVSPCIRLEPVESIQTGRHLTEFRQVDIEKAYATYDDAMKLAERMLQYVITRVKRKCADELKVLERELRIPKIPFKRITHRKIIDTLRSMGFEVRYDEEIPWKHEEILSSQFKEPFFITDYPITARGFYYLEHRDKHFSPPLLKDFDLIFPEGFGEAISGGEREYRHGKVVKRMERSGEDLTKYGWYLDMLKQGIPPSAGFGIGVERLTRFVCGLRDIWDAVPFPKVAGVISP